MGEELAKLLSFHQNIKSVTMDENNQNGDRTATASGIGVKTNCMRVYRRTYKEQARYSLLSDKGLTPASTSKLSFCEDQKSQRQNEDFHFGLSQDWWPNVKCLTIYDTGIIQF